MYSLLDTFELVPSPQKERTLIKDILEKSQRKHGDVYYVLSYRWWDLWLYYVSTAESLYLQHGYSVKGGEEFAKKKHTYVEDVKNEFNEVFQRSHFAVHQASPGVKRLESKVRESSVLNIEEENKRTRMSNPKERGIPLLSEEGTNPFARGEMSERRGSLASDDHMLLRSTEFQQMSMAWGDKPGAIDNADIEGEQPG